MQSKRVLVLSPHSDDAELGVGAYLAKVASEGGEVIVALSTVGNSQSLRLSREIVEEERLEEFRAAMKILGVQRTIVLTRGMDGRLREYPMAEMVRALDLLQKDFEPDEVLIPLPSFHQDHRYCWEAGLATTRPSMGKHMPRLIAAYEYPGNCWGSDQTTYPAQGWIYVDATRTWHRKVEALKQHRSQMEHGALIGIDGATAMATLRGLESGYEKAERMLCLKLRYD
jgi:LmbE family N-acetylglucosaminyl deacetylase